MQAPHLIVFGPYISERCQLCGEKIKNDGAYWKSADSHWHIHCLRLTPAGQFEAMDVDWGSSRWNKVTFEGAPFDPKEVADTARDLRDMLKAMEGGKS